jgi:hypothetical protein
MESQAGQPARDSTGLITTISGQPVKHRDVDRLAWIQATIAACVPADYGDMLALLTYTVACGHGYQLRRLRPTSGPAVCSSPPVIAQSKIAFYQRFPGGIE